MKKMIINNFPFNGIESFLIMEKEMRKRKTKKKSEKQLKYTSVVLQSVNIPASELCIGFHFHRKSFKI